MCFYSVTEQLHLTHTHKHTHKRTHKHTNTRVHKAWLVSLLKQNSFFSLNFVRLMSDSGAPRAPHSVGTFPLFPSGKAVLVQRWPHLQQVPSSRIDGAVPGLPPYTFTARAAYSGFHVIHVRAFLYNATGIHARVQKFLNNVKVWSSCFDSFYKQIVHKVLAVCKRPLPVHWISHLSGVYSIRNPFQGK